MSFWDNICIHACYHSWNPVIFVLREEWVEAVWRQYGPDYPGWSA